MKKGFSQLAMVHRFIKNGCSGAVAEWSKALVLKDDINEN